MCASFEHLTVELRAMTKKYHVYGLGAALVDTEVEVNDEFLSRAGIEKGVMTLVDEERQHRMPVARKHIRIWSAHRSY